MNEYIDKKQVIDKFIEGDGDNEFTEGYNFAVNEYREKIKAMSAADVQPVKHGQWIIKDNHFHSNIILNYAECSCCGHTCSTTESTHNNYCPNCGARMDGDKE